MTRDQSGNLILLTRRHMPAQDDASPFETAAERAALARGCLGLFALAAHDFPPTTGETPPDVQAPNETNATAAQPRL